MVPRTKRRYTARRTMKKQTGQAQISEAVGLRTEKSENAQKKKRGQKNKTKDEPETEREREGKVGGRKKEKEVKRSSQHQGWGRECERGQKENGKGSFRGKTHRTRQLVGKPLVGSGGGGTPGLGLRPKKRRKSTKELSHKKKTNG